MRISDWSSDVCSSDLVPRKRATARNTAFHHARRHHGKSCRPKLDRWLGLPLGSGCLPRRSAALRKESENMDDLHAMNSRTRLVHAGRHPHDNYGVVNPPVYHASTILQPSLEVWEASRKPDFTGYRYGRAGTPTSRSFEEAVAAM